MPLFNAIPPSWGFTSGRYYTPPGVISTDASSLSTLILSPYIVTVPFTVAGLALEVTTPQVAGTARLGVYGTNSGGLPSNLLVDSGVISTTCTGIVESVVSLPLSPGLYWTGAVNQGVASTLRVINFSQGVVSATTPGTAGILSGIIQGSVTTTLPTSFSGTLHTNLAPRVWLKAA